MSILWMDSFDHYGTVAKMLDGVFTDIGGGLRASGYAGISARTGGYYLECSNNNMGYRRPLGGNYRIVGAAGGYWFNAFQGSSLVTLLSFRDADNNVQISIGVDSTGALIIAKKGDGKAGADPDIILVNASPDLVTGAYQHVEGRIDCDAVNGAIEVRVNGVTKVNLTGINTRPYTTATGGAGRIAQVAARTNNTTGTLGFVVDDIFAWAVTGVDDELNTDFIGDRKVYTLFTTEDTSVADYDVHLDIVAKDTADPAAQASDTLTLVAPDSPEAGELWIATVHTSDQVAHSFSGWTQILQQNGPSTDSRISVWYFHYEGIVPNLTIAHSAGQCICGGIQAFKNCKRSGDPVDTLGSVNTGTDGSIEHTGITPSQAGCTILAINGTGAGGVGHSALAGFVNALNFSTGAGNDGSFNLQYELDAPVSATGTLTVNQGSSLSWVSVLIALAPDDAPSGYDAINEVPPDDDTTYIKFDTPAGSVERDGDFIFEDLPAEAVLVTAVQTYHRSKKTDAGVADMQVSMLAEGDIAGGTDRPITTAYTYWTDVFELNPHTGAPFLPEELNDAGLRISRTD